MDNSPQNGQGVPPALPFDMNAVFAWILNVARTHGLSFALLIFAVLHFHRRTEGLEADIKQCQQNHLQTVQTQNVALVTALEQNTQALNRLEASIIRKQ